MSLTQTFIEHVRACFTGLWIHSYEHTEALRELAAVCREQTWHFTRWNLASGMTSPHSGDEHGPNDNTATDPLAALRAFAALATSGTADATRILVLENYHRFLQSAEVVQHLVAAMEAGKSDRSIIVILSPVVEIPVELQKLIVVLEHELPTREQLTSIARELATDAGELPTGSEWEQLLDASVGLTRQEAENAFSLSLVRHGCLKPGTLWEQKSQMLKKSGILTLYRGSENFQSLGGLENLKSFTRQALLSSRRDRPRRRPRGVLLLSPPGCGKSAFCKALGNEVGRPVLQLDVGALLGSLVGQTEQRTREALAIIDAMAPCIVMLDEVEKAFGGAAQGSAGDSGVGSRMFGTFLSWLNDHQSDVFVVCTANDVSRLPPEFGRAERFDGVFFVDLPTDDEKSQIWDLYLREYELAPMQPRPNSSQWTGAEIKACCRLAALLDLPVVDAAQQIVPVAVTSGESIESLRNWARGRCLDAAAPGLYGRSTHPAATQPPRNRRGIGGIGPNPSRN